MWCLGWMLIYAAAYGHFAVCIYGLLFCVSVLKLFCVIYLRRTIFRDFNIAGVVWLWRLIEIHASY